MDHLFGGIGDVVGRGEVIQKGGEVLGGFTQLLEDTASFKQAIPSHRDILFNYITDRQQYFQDIITYCLLLDKVVKEDALFQTFVEFQLVVDLPINQIPSWFSFALAQQIQNNKSGLNFWAKKLFQHRFRQKVFFLNKDLQQLQKIRQQYKILGVRIKEQHPQRTSAKDIQNIKYLNKVINMQKNRRFEYLKDVSQKLTEFYVLFFKKCHQIAEMSTSYFKNLSDSQPETTVLQTNVARNKYQNHNKAIKVVPQLKQQAILKHNIISSQIGRINNFAKIQTLSSRKYFPQYLQN